MATQVRFLSLFVSDLEDAARRYEAFLGVAPSKPGALAADPAPNAFPPAAAARPPAPHPFASAGPVVFDLGAVALALYQIDGRTTQAGDLGIGLETDEPAAALAKRSQAQGGQPFHGPAPLPGGDRNLVILMTPERHFFEIVGG